MAGASRKKPRSPIAGRYRLESSLGEGGGGEVFLVQDLQEEGRPLALKRVGLAKKNDTPLLEDLKNEFSTLRRLSHPNLASVYDFGSSDREFFFTSEYIAGRDILAATRQADLNTVFHLIVQILRALDYLHRRGVLHLDLKPANILVTDPNRTGELTVKLIDFGIAQWKKQGRLQSGDFSGTPPYAAPEMAMGKDPSPSSDLYSMGMILHQVFTGKFPFPSQDPLEILLRQTTQDPERVGHLDPALPSGFAELLDRLVARSPEARFSSAREVLEALNASLGENFSLRSPHAPVRILEESDHEFHSEFLSSLARTLSEPGSVRVELRGPSGSGKTWLLERVKAQAQIHGLRPLYFKKLQAVHDYLAGGGREAFPPLILDWNEPPDDLLALSLESYPAPLLWTDSSEESGAKASNLQRLDLPSLDEAALSRFFREELQRVPDGIAKKCLQEFSPLYPGDLEGLLQALREEGAMVWGSGGWIWQGGEGFDFAGLTARQSQRRDDRKKSVREFLESSGLSLAAGVLEGMLGLESGAMRDSLESWTQEGWLTCRLQRGLAHYQASSGAGVGSEAALPKVEPLRMTEQLERLYEQGRFAAACAWIDQIEREDPRSLQDPRLCLRAARHLVSGGHYQRALDLLSREAPLEAKERGLYHEIRGRALHRLGKFSEAEAEARQSETAFGEGKDFSGVARALNLLGGLAKDQNRYAEAEADFFKAVETALTADDYYCAGIVQANLALAHHLQGKIEIARDDYRRAWEFAQKNQNPFFLQVLYHNWVNLLYSMGKADDAERACYEWLNLALRYRAREQQAYAFNYLALLAELKGHAELHRSYLDQAIALLEPSRAPRLAAQFRVNRAFLNWAEEKFLPAQLDAESALQWARLLPEDPVLAWVDLILGIVYRDRPQADLAKAGEFLEQAWQRAERQQSRSLWWEINFHRGLLEKRRGNLELARERFRSAERSLQEMIQGLPGDLKTSYLRDRKVERIQAELQSLEPDAP